MTDDNGPLSVGGWLITMIILMIPLVNIVMLLVWAFGNGNECRSNWAKANLIFIVILIVLMVVLTILGVANMPAPDSY